MPECRLCGREVSKVTKHHLVPKQKGGMHRPTVDLCRPCHKTIHATFTNTQLVQKFNTLEKLQNAEELQTYLDWVKDKPIENMPVRKRKK